MEAIALRSFSRSNPNPNLTGIILLNMANNTYSTEGWLNNVNYVICEHFFSTLALIIIKTY